MQRADGKSIPIAVLPNGSGNDTSRALKIESFEMGIDYFEKAQTVKYDIFKILIDYESEEELKIAMKKDPYIQLRDHLRYCVINSSLSVAAKTSRDVGPLKNLIGKNAYTL